MPTRPQLREWIAKDPLNNSRAWVKVLDKFWDGSPSSDLKLSSVMALDEGHTS